MIRRINYSLDRATICHDILKTLEISKEDRLDLSSLVQEKLMFAYYIGDDPIGFISLTTHNYYCIEVSYIAVSKSHQLQKIGTALMNEVIDYAEKNDFRVIEAKINPKFREKRFFELLSFIPLEVIDDKQIYILTIKYENN